MLEKSVEKFEDTNFLTPYIYGVSGKWSLSHLVCLSTEPKIA
jgi:hypothetical protein